MFQVKGDLTPDAKGQVKALSIVTWQVFVTYFSISGICFSSNIDKTLLNYLDFVFESTLYLKVMLCAL